MATTYKARAVRRIGQVGSGSEGASLMGKRCARLFASGKIVVSQEGRRGGAELRRAFCEALLREGGALGKDFDLVQVDHSTASLFSLLVSYYRASGGAMIQSSGVIKAVRDGRPF